MTIRSILHVNAAFPLSCAPLRTPRLTHRSWWWDFFEIWVLEVEMFLYDLLRLHAIWSRNDWSVSAKSWSVSDGTTYLLIALPWSSSRWGLDPTGVSDLGRSDTCIECLTRDRGVACSSLTGGTALCLWARHFILCLVLVQPRKTLPDITDFFWLGRKESNQTNKQLTN